MFKLEIEPAEKIQTKFGTAKIHNNRYYMITSCKEGNHGKYLHRLIWEDFYGPIPEGWIIHHKDENKLNNCICNLELMRKEDHNSHHNEKYARIWDIEAVHYHKEKMFQHGREPNPCKCFSLKYKGRYVPIGYFHDFLTPKIINDIAKEEEN